jgi:hypothetical protein
MCVGRLKDGMVKEPVWKGEIRINRRDFLVSISRPRRSIRTGKSIYLAYTEYNGEIISIDKEAYSMDEALTLLRNQLKKI